MTTRQKIEKELLKLTLAPRSGSEPQYDEELILFLTGCVNILAEAVDLHELEIEKLTMKLAKMQKRAKRKK